MNQVQTAPTFVEKIVEMFEDFEKNTNSKPFAQKHPLRKEALQHFASAGFPTTKHEEWKYTNLKKLLNSSFNSTISQPIDLSFLKTIVEEQLPENLDGYKLIFYGNQFISELSTIHQGRFFVGNLADAYASHASVIDAYFGKLSDEKSSVFQSLNLAFAWHGAFVYVPKNNIVEKPIWILHIAPAENSISQLRNLVILEENTEAKLIEQCLAFGKEKSFFNKVTECFVASHARLKHYILQDDISKDGIPESFQISHHCSHQQKESLYENYTFTLGGNFVRNNLTLLLNGEHCEGNMYGLYMLDHQSHVDNHTAVDHLVPHAQSNQLYKGILDGKATGVFNGKIFVRPHAQKTNAFQSNRTILLSDQATIDTKPQLEIWADDVKCSHGATVGSLDTEPLFYLKARGIPEQKARAMLIMAFAMDLIEKVGNDALKTLLFQRIMQKLNYQE